MRNLSGQEDCYEYKLNSQLKNTRIMELKHDEHFALHLGFAIAKLALKAAVVAGIFCMAKEAHKIHKAIEQHERK